MFKFPLRRPFHLILYFWNIPSETSALLFSFHILILAYRVSVCAYVFYSLDWLQVLTIEFRPIDVIFKWFDCIIKALFDDKYPSSFYFSIYMYSANIMSRVESFDYFYHFPSCGVNGSDLSCSSFLEDFKMSINMNSPGFHLFVAVHPPSPNTGLIPLSIRWSFRLAGYVIGLHDQSANLSTLSFYSDIRSIIICVANQWVDGWDRTIKKIKIKSNNKQRTSHDFVTIMLFSF